MLLWILLLANQVSSDNVNLMSSTYQITELFKHEQKFIHELKSYLSELKSEVANIEEFLAKNYASNDIENVENQEEYISHPINALGVVRRTCVDNIQHLKVLKNGHTNPIETRRKRLKAMTKLAPSMNDYVVAAQSIALLQESYDLDINYLNNGVILGYKSDYNLSMYDRISIGTQAANRKWFDSAIEWLEKALEYPDPEMEKIAKSQLKQMKHLHDQILDKRGPISGGHKTFPIPFDTKLQKKKKYKKILKQGPRSKLKSEVLIRPLFEDFERSKRRQEDYNGNFRSLCQNGDADNWRKDYQVDQDLNCRFLHHLNPFLKMGPFKIEELNENPYVISIKDFIYDKEMEFLKTNAKTDLHLSRIGTTKGQDDFFRSSKQSWIIDKSFEIFNGTKEKNQKVFYINDEKDPKNIYNLPLISLETNQVSLNLNRRISLLSQMRTQAPYASEYYQVANYGVGGQYGTHWDAFNLHKTDIGQDMGDRIATLMAYLSDVQVGGNTAFPMLGISVAPERGSALFWVNLKPFGHSEPLSLHGGCPVVVGSKWITNKWIKYYDQAFAFPCGLNSDSKHELKRRFKK